MKFKVNDHFMYFIHGNVDEPAEMLWMITLYLRDDDVFSSRKIER